MKILITIPSDLLPVSPEEMKAAYIRASKRHKTDPFCIVVLSSVTIGILVLMVLVLIVLVRYSQLGFTAKMILGLCVSGIAGVALGMTTKYLTLKLVVQEIIKGRSKQPTEHTR